MSRPRPLSEMFPSAIVDALDLMRIGLQFNPSKRTYAKDALLHPYVLQFHCDEEEFDVGRVIRIPIDDNTKLPVEDYRERLYHEVLKKKKEQKRSHRKNLEMQQLQHAVHLSQTHNHTHASPSGHSSSANGSHGIHGSYGSQLSAHHPPQHRRDYADSGC